MTTSSSTSYATDGEQGPGDYSPFATYFVGPRDFAHHSRWPLWLQLHGSVVPQLILPLAIVGIWATAITCITLLLHDISFDSVLLTVLGFVVALSLSFRSSTAYDRYKEGSRYWSQLGLVTQGFARLVWIHAKEREDHASEDLLGKISFCNMLATFAIALKYRLRFEPFTHYEDLQPRIQQLDILAKNAPRRDWTVPSRWKLMGMVLGLSMAESNPRKLIKDPKHPLGNVPLEILTYCSAYIKTIIDNGTMPTPAYHAQAMTLLTQMNDIITGTERIVNTPLPVAYSIAIAQITWVYILLLPFQLVQKLGWVAIPTSVLAGYIIIGIAMIGREIENPFGEDVNDLSLDVFCNRIREDIDNIMSLKPPTLADFVERKNNMVLYPLSAEGFDSLKVLEPQQIRHMLKARLELRHRA